MLLKKSSLLLIFFILCLTCNSAVFGDIIRHCNLGEDCQLFYDSTGFGQVEFNLPVSSYIKSSLGTYTCTFTSSNPAVSLYLSLAWGGPDPKNAVHMSGGSAFLSNNQSSTFQILWDNPDIQHTGVYVVSINADPALHFPKNPDVLHVLCKGGN